MRILLVDDDDLLVQSLVAHLTNQNYVIDVASNGKDGWEYAQAATYDLIVLDVNLPQLDGISLCQRLRQNGYSRPILLLTAKGDSTDKVLGLDAGADDYVVKPCSIEELSARMRALVRRQSAVIAPTLTWGDLNLDPSTCEVCFQGQEISLSPKEYGLLELFLRHPQRIFSSSVILERLWGFEETPGEETVRTHIKRLRRKLKQVGAGDAIENIYGMGYRLKAAAEPSSTQAELAESARSTEPDKPTAAAEQARAATLATWDQFKGKILERVAILDQALVALQQETLSEELGDQARQAAHKLAGSLGMFGFAEGSRLGQAIEDWFLLERDTKQCLLEDNPPSLTQLQSLITRLHTELQHPPQPFGISSQPSPSLSTAREDLPLLLVVDDDPTIIQQLQAESIHYDLQIIAALDVAQAKAILAETRPNAVLLDLALPNSPKEGLQLLDELSTFHPTLPVLVFTVRDEFRDRLEVARRKSYTFISKTTPSAQVLDAVQNALRYSSPPDVKVLAVDDDPLVLMALKQSLPRWGIEVFTLENPLQFWNTLESVAPDLLILDVDMPDVSGIELCQVIRNDNAWNGLPILFLSARRDADTIHRLYSVGADDYVPKPFTEPELVTRIFNRLERNRMLRNLAETDQLTGIANRRRSIKELNRYLTLSRRYHQPLCLAILDLDYFKQVNDQWGHEIGDRVLKRLARILQQTFRSEDVVARWGGEEFLVGMYGMKKQQAAERLAQVLKKVREEGIAPSTLVPLRLTFSAGIAEAPEDGIDLQSLYRAADGALYAAKTAGRDQIKTVQALKVQALEDL